MKKHLLKICLLVSAISAVFVAESAAKAKKNKTVKRVALEAAGAKKTQATAETAKAERAANKIAVAEPVAKGGITKKQIAGLWSVLESKVDGGYELVSRSALNSMLTEIGLANNSGLVDLNSKQKADLGRLKGVKYILISEVSKVGKKLVFNLRLIDASTGTIDPTKKISVIAENVDEVVEKLDDTLAQIKLSTVPRKRGLCVLLFPKTSARVSQRAAGEFYRELQNTLIENRVKLYNLQAVNQILKKNNISDLRFADPSVFKRVGELLRADKIIQPVISKYKFYVTQRYIKSSDRTVTNRIGSIIGTIKVISTRNGEVVGSVRFRTRIDFADVDEDTEEWEKEDFEQYLLEQVLDKYSKKLAKMLK